MMGVVAVLLCPPPPAVTPPSRFRTVLFAPHTDFVSAADHPVRWCARAVPPEGRKYDAISGRPTGIPLTFAFGQGTDVALTSCNAVKVSLNNGVHPGRGMPVIHLPPRTSPLDDDDDEGCFLDVDRTSRRIRKIKAMLRSMDDGEISISAYDTAWVALVPDLRGGHGPQFMSSLQWIKDNQLPDGSWGDPDVFISFDRLLSTLASVIALKSWRVCPDKCQRGVAFLWGNMHRLEEEEEDHMPIGFEVAFPSLLEMARSLNLDVPYDAPGLRGIHLKRALKLERIPTDVMHRLPTTLLHSLEGMPTLDWEKLLRLQCADGSFLFSPASTAFALTQTRDSKCLAYLEKTVQRFNGGVPNVYPVDMFEHLWAVDRLERLGISRYFEEEIGLCLDYVHKYWSEDGIGWARNSSVHDVDDTSMGFRLLRLHGYAVSPEVFRRFEKNGNFFCFSGQSNQAITGIYNLYRASQMCFPGEKILELARSFSHEFLREKQSRGELSDKWIITKDLPGEVGYTLDFPWFANLPRVETRYYLDQYGGDRDVWIGKTLYRMPCVNNDEYLELAKSDFARCQALHQLELLGLQRWFGECDLHGYGIGRQSLLRSYFLAASSIFEPERAAERLGWARTAVLAEAVSAHLRGGRGRAARLLSEIKAACSPEDGSVAPGRVLSSSSVAREENDRSQGRKGTLMGLAGVLLHTLDRLALDAAASVSSGGEDETAIQRQIRQHLRRTWEDWLLAWRGEEDEESHVRCWWPGGAENDETGSLLVRSVELCAGRTGLEDSLPTVGDQQYERPAHLVSLLCTKLRRFHRHNLLMAEGERKASKGNAGDVESQDIERDMQELLLLVLRNPLGIGGSHCTLKIFLTIAKSFYYVAHCPPPTLDAHIAMVLFERVV